MTLTFENEQDFDLGFDPEEVAAAVINGVLDQEACPYEAEVELDELKHSVQNASYEQKDPLLIFKLESVNLFDNMVNKINNNTISVLMRGQIPVQEPEQVREAAPEPQAPRQQYREEKQDLSDPHQQAAAEHDTREVKREPVRAEKTVGRNDPCPCGSGKKYKNCHGQNA